MSKFQPNRSFLSCNELEDRSTPAQFGVPWTDPMHLTLSFAPDGTSIAGVASRLNTALDATMPRATWQDAVLRAFQTWSEVANVNVGLVADGGQPFGVAGSVQADPRFGDIRVAGLPMSADALAVSVPPAAFVTGTYAGDMVVNTAGQFTPTSLYAVALHEAGHVLGLPHSTDPKSVMFSHLNSIATLSSADIAAIRALYGPRTPDANEGAKGNDIPKNATPIKYSVLSSGYTGSTPLVAYGDVTTRADADVFSLRGYPGYTGPISIRVQTSGISLLAPRVTIYSATGVQLAQSTATGNRGGVVTLTLPTSIPDATYYIKVEAAPGAAVGVGRYGLAATFDGLIKPTALTIDQVLRGPYESLSPEEMGKLFVAPSTVLFADDLHTNDTVAFATNLRPGPGQPSDLHLQTTASLSDRTDVDFYRVKSPKVSGTATWVLTTSVRAAGANGVTPRVEVYDGNFNRLLAEVIVNGNGTYTVQATGIAPGSNVFLRVFSPTGVGNYNLDVTFGSVAADLQTFAANTLPTTNSTASYTVYVARPQLFSLSLSATGATGSVRMDFLNSAGVVVYSLTAAVGETVTGISTLLPPGTYTVRVTALGTTGPVSFRLRGAAITDPVGPVIDSTTLAPQFQAPQDPTKYLYPNGTLTTAAFLWLFRFIG